MQAPTIAGALWNVDDILADCALGAFGSPRAFPIDAVPAETFARDGLDLAKMEAYSRTPYVLGLPVVCLMQADGISVHSLLDGRHRLAALTMRGDPTFLAYAVPAGAEHAYRIPTNVYYGLHGVLRQHPRRARGQARGRRAPDAGHLHGNPHRK